MIINKVSMMLPLYKELSKNSWVKVAHGRKYIPDGNKQKMKALIAEIKLNTNGIKWVKKEKVWVSATVKKGFYVTRRKNGTVYQTPSRLDAINLIDSYCDAIKNAIGIDDINFALGKWDYTERNEIQDVCVELSIWQEIKGCGNGKRQGKN